MLSDANAANLAAYYERTNSGDFMGVLDLLTEDVVYRQPGPASIPYSGEWKGKTAVIRLFQAFAASFGLVDMVEARSISSEDQVFSVNDEIFTSRTTGQPWRAGVVHHIQFDQRNLISSLDNYVDLAPAVQALAGHSAVVVPVPDGERLEGEDELDSGEAEEVVRRYYASWPDVAGLLSPDVVACMPGDPRRLRFSGRWSGPSAVSRMLRGVADTIGAQPVVESVLANQGAVVAKVGLDGTFKPTGERVSVRLVDVLQLDRGGRIGRVGGYFDTTTLTLPKGAPLPAL